MAIINILVLPITKITGLHSHNEQNRKKHDTEAVDTEDHSDYEDGNSDKGHRLSLGNKTSCCL